MKGTNKIKDQTQLERNSASSTRQLVFDDYLYTVPNEQRLNQQQISIKKTKDNSQKLQKVSEFSPPQSLIERPTFRGPHGTTKASTIIWYVCICILFIIAFLSLVLSILYFLINSSTEQVIKLYGITGAGSLAIVTFVIIFLDCCTDGDREDNEEEAIYRILQIKDIKDERLAKRRKRRMATVKEEKLKPVVVQHQRPQQAPIEPHPYRHHYYSQPHHIHSHSPISYHDSYACPVCHKSHALRYSRYNRADVGVDTSDRFEPLPKIKHSGHKSTHDAQTESKSLDTEHGTQTSAVELNSLQNNVTETICETTIRKTSRNRLPELKKSMEQEDKVLALNQTVADTNSLTVSNA